MDDKIQEAYNKMLEGTNIKAAIKSMDRKKATELKRAYYSIADNVGNLNQLLSEVDELSEEFKYSKDVLYSFNKMNLGKYI